MGVYRARSLLGLSAEALHRLLIGWLGDPDLQYGPQKGTLRNGCIS